MRMNIESNIQPIATEIYKYYETFADSGHRSHLGASLIGEECLRKLWYTFRWCKKNEFPGRILILFETGQREEDRIVNMLRNIGLIVYDRDPNNQKKQIRIEHNKHISGSLDGMIEYDGKWHVLEIKTHNDKQFNVLTKKGVQVSHPKHYTQMQIYMKKIGVDRALYFAKNKNTDEIYTERIKLDEVFADQQLRKAETVVNSTRPPQGVGANQADFRCKFCDYIDICHQKKIVTEINCRTCVHSTPTEIGWACDIHTDCRVCDDHKLIPDLVSLDVVDAGEDYIEYEHGLKNGKNFLKTPEFVKKLLTQYTSDDIIKVYQD